MSNSLVKNKEGEEVGSILGGGTRVEAPTEAQACADEVVYQEMSLEAGNSDSTEVDMSILDSSSPESSDDDIDFLDLLVDSLDGEFDPDLLI